jgi:hypothetical protein
MTMVSVRVKIFAQPIEVAEAEASALRHQGLIVDEPAETPPPAQPSTPAAPTAPVDPAATATPASHYAPAPQ